MIMAVTIRSANYIFGYLGAHVLCCGGLFQVVYEVRKRHVKRICSDESNEFDVQSRANVDV